MERKMFFLLLGVFCFVAMSIVFANADKLIEVGDCFDSNGNKIVGVSCEVESYDSYTNLIIVLLFISCILSLILSLWYIIDEK